MQNNGEFKFQYVERLKTLAINGNLVKSMRNINKLDIPVSKLNQLNEDLSGLLSLEKLEDIKKVNRGLYQLLIWVLMVYEFQKIFNPFEFISSEYITTRFDKEDLDIIKYYCEVMNYLRYNLKIKFKFCKGFEFNKLFTEIKEFIRNQNMNTEGLFEVCQDYEKISKIYFDTKDVYIFTNQLDYTHWS